MDHYDRVQKAVGFIKSKIAVLPVAGVVLGSGLGDVGSALDRTLSIPYRDITGWPTATAAGHKGVLSFGTIEGVPVAVMEGRVHYYEGYDIQDVVFPIRVLGTLGIKSLFLTNASGGINLGYVPGELAAIYDHINMTGANPLIAPNEERWGPRFPDMTYAYDRQYLEMLSEIAILNGIKLHRAVYIGMSGPSYETPAEIRMARIMGADVVGMSTVPEVITANHMGIRVAAVSCISNYAAGITSDRLTHSEVLERMTKVAGELKILLKGFMSCIHR